MKKITITVGSVTYAIRLKKLLIRKGIAARLVKTDGDKNTVGCSHGVEISESDLFGAVKIMRDAGIEYSLAKQRYDIS